MKRAILLLAAIIFASCDSSAIKIDKEDKPSTQTVTLSLDKTSASYNCVGGSDSFTVTSGTQPKASSDAIWCGVKVGKIGTDKKTKVEVFAGVNAGVATRSSIVTVECGGKKLSFTVNQEAFSAEVAETTPVTIEEFYNRMAPGWNMGNHMEAHSNGVSSETVWGNSLCTQALPDALKAAGFKTIRIPVTWSGHIGDGPDYTLDQKWLERVAAIVGYCEKDGLNVIVNMHHDDQIWLDIKKASSSLTDHDEILAKYTQVWYQIASRFADKGDWLMFEACNEVQDGGWGWSADFQKNPSAQYKCMNEWLQCFVRAVRMAGGENATRWLGIPGYCANLDFGIKGLVMPKDYTTENRLAFAFHNYDPYEYTLNCEKGEWGHTAKEGNYVIWSGGQVPNEQHLVSVMAKAVANFQSKGVPTYIGEYGCSFRSDKREQEFHKYYMEYFTKAAHNALLPACIWDNGTRKTGKECHGYFDHGTGAFISYSGEIVERVVRAATDTDPNYTLDSVYQTAPTDN